MKNKLTKIFAVIALVLIAPIGVLLTGCGEKEPTLVAKSTNNSVLHIGDTLEDANWKVEYFDGTQTITIAVTSDMVLGFDTSSVTTSEKTATIVYNNLTTTQTYSVVKGTPKITAKNTNRTTFYIGETFESVKWQIDYFDGENTTTIDVTEEMIANFKIDEEKSNVTASIVYNGLVATQTYSVLATAFNTNAIYLSTDLGEQYNYIKFSANGSSITLLSAESEESDLTLNSELWDYYDADEYGNFYIGDKYYVITTISFTSSGFNADGQWEAIAEEQAEYGEDPTIYKFVKISDTSITCSVSGLDSPLTMHFTAI